MTLVESGPHHQSDGEFDAYPSGELIEASLKSQDLLLQAMLDTDADDQVQAAAELQRRLSGLSANEFSLLIKKLVESQIDEAQLEAMRIVSVDQMSIIDEQRANLDGWSDLVRERDRLAYEVSQLEKRIIPMSEALAVAIEQSDIPKREQIFDALAPRPDTSDTPTLELPVTKERPPTITERVGTHVLAFLRKEKPAA